MKKGFKGIVLAAMTVASVAALAACGTSSSGDKFGLIALHDESSTYDANFIKGFKAACEAKKVEAKIVTGIPETNKCYEAAADLADQGCKGVFADSFGHEAHIAKAASEFADVQFSHATGTSSKYANKDQANFHNAFASIYEGRYLAGVVAGLKLQEMEAAGKIEAKNKDANGNIKLGYIGAYTYAEVISGYTSWYLGVKSIMPNVVMDVTFTGSWYDEVAEGNGANTLIDGGAALISQHADSMGAPSACEAKNVPNVSYNGSTAAKCPNTYLVSSRINWQPYFEMMIEKTLAGESYAKDYCGTIETGSVELAEYGKNVAAGTAEKIDEVKANLKSGKLHVFDTSKFTVTVVAPDADGNNGKNAGATVDADGHLTAYLADVDGDYKGDTNVVSNGYFDESNAEKYRSAPYFDLQIDGINLLNVKF
ncbi:MAG: BMP family ABC transporter substrate-binding protein [Bacilli bacterium]|nr:BMP family ABC transporter substrate-binding protein [Bacilli bacterium]